jgi:thymidylate synthase
MRVIEARNAHQALPEGLFLLDAYGQKQTSRFGDVVVAPWPVSTVYSRAYERIVWWPERDFNIAFCVYESLWMLAGRNDVEPLKRYVKTFDQFSDDGVILHGAYGFRWRSHFDVDQIEHIVDLLKRNPRDRRCVLQMWDCGVDLGTTSKDIPCNDMATFQIGANGALNMTVFCRSNDIIWGAYFANAFHFGFLLEYMAARIGVPMGSYTQISVNYHAYENVLKSVKTIAASKTQFVDRYVGGDAKPARLEGPLDEIIAELLNEADGRTQLSPMAYDWAIAAQAVLYAHECYRNCAAPVCFELSVEVIDAALRQVPDNDWLTAMRIWLMNRWAKYLGEVRA